MFLTFGPLKPVVITVRAEQVKRAKLSKADFFTPRETFIYLQESKQRFLDVQYFC